MNHRTIGIGLCLVASLALPCHAGPQGDAARGEAKAAVCASCHGPGGNSVDPQFPILAGQVPGYTARQLAAFKSGARSDPVMAPMAAALSEQDMADLDAYYSDQSQDALFVSEDEVAMAKRGERLYRGGYRPFQIAPCMGCHGPAGHGIPPRFPRVSGQYAGYLEKQLLEFKSGSRESEVMNPIAFKLSHAQIRELSLYLSALH